MSEKVWENKTNHPHQQIIDVRIKVSFVFVFWGLYGIQTSVWFLILYASLKSLSEFWLTWPDRAAQLCFSTPNFHRFWVSHVSAKSTQEVQYYNEPAAIWHITPKKRECKLYLHAVVSPVSYPLVFRRCFFKSTTFNILSIYVLKIQPLVIHEFCAFRNISLRTTDWTPSSLWIYSRYCLTKDSSPDPPVILPKVRLDRACSYSILFFTTRRYPSEETHVHI